MSTLFRSPWLVPLAFLVSLVLPAQANNLVGNWQCQPGNASIAFQSNGSLVFDGETLSYQIAEGRILVAEDYGWQPYPYQLLNNQLSIQFPDGSVMHCSQSASRQSPSMGSPQGTNPYQQPNNAQLQQDIAGIWWGYSGSTERKIGLCPGGVYMDYTESSYSGSSYNSFGDETMAWGAASQNSSQGRWSIQGDYQSGTIFVNTNQGGQFQWHYRQVGEPGCLDISGHKLCRTSAHCN